MNTNIQRIIGNFWFWLGFSLLLIVTVLAVQNVSRRAETATIPETGAPAAAQSVPEAAVQGVTDYLKAHSNPSGQAVPDASVQSVADYLRLHSADQPPAAITDPAVKSVMDYLKAHGIQP
jgi:hypothetical protein